VSFCGTVVYFGKSHKDRVVIVPHELICMIPGLVLPTHLEHELVCNCILNLTPYLLDSESVLNSFSEVLVILLFNHEVHPTRTQKS
jgi:hypothetical protein